MENLMTMQLLNRTEHLLEKHIFTKLQLNVLKKKIKHRPLDKNEKTYYYKFIKPKVKALLAFSGTEDSVVQGREYMLPERISLAKKIVKQMRKKHRTAKILVSGSFLFNKEYNDIDVFVFTKYHKEDYRWKNIHINFLPETALDSLFFSSVYQISLSTFAADTPKNIAIPIKEILQTYESLVNEILNKENYQKKLRDFLLQTEYISNGQVLNPKQLYVLRHKYSKKNMLVLLQKHLAETLALSYTKGELSLLKQYIKDYRRLSKEYKESTNLENYIDTYKEALELAG